MKKLIAALLSVVLLIVLPCSSALSAPAVIKTQEELAALIYEQQQFIAANPKATPADYISLMNQNPCFNIRAYMYYNEDLMSKYTYNYWMYYKHYLDKGYKEARQCVFPAEDAYNTSTIGRYSTPYQTKIPREINLQLACQFINGTVLQPGQLFSYNAVVGPRSTERGFQVAPIYSGGKVASGVGGGICQISSTLYVAMMIAGIPATEHHFHSLPVHYLKSNLDATVSWGTADLKFINPYDYPIVITAAAVDGVATVAISKYTGK